MNATLETAQLKLRADMLRMLRRDREKLISDLCISFDCDEDKLLEEVGTMKEDFDSLVSVFNCKPESLSEEVEKIADLVRGLCKVLDCEPNELESKVETFQKERKEDNDLREQIRVLKEATNEEETLI
jgi:hypothetical protein